MTFDTRKLIGKTIAAVEIEQAQKYGTRTEYPDLRSIRFTDGTILLLDQRSVGEGMRDAIVPKIYKQ